MTQNHFLAEMPTTAQLPTLAVWVLRTFDPINLKYDEHQVNMDCYASEAVAFLHLREQELEDVEDETGEAYGAAIRRFESLKALMQLNPGTASDPNLSSIGFYYTLERMPIWGSLV